MQAPIYTGSTVHHPVQGHRSHLVENVQYPSFKPQSVQNGSHSHIFYSPREVVHESTRTVGTHIHTTAPTLVANNQVLSRPIQVQPTVTVTPTQAIVPAVQTKVASSTKVANNVVVQPTVIPATVVENKAVLTVKPNAVESKTRHNKHNELHHHKHSHHAQISKPTHHHKHVHAPHTPVSTTTPVVNTNTTNLVNNTPIVTTTTTNLGNTIVVKNNAVSGNLAPMGNAVNNNVNSKGSSSFHMNVHTPSPDNIFLKSNTNLNSTNFNTNKSINNSTNNYVQPSKPALAASTAPAINNAVVPTTTVPAIINGKPSFGNAGNARPTDNVVFSNNIIGQISARTNVNTNPNDTNTFNSASIISNTNTIANVNTINLASNLNTIETTNTNNNNITNPTNNINNISNTNYVNNLSYPSQFTTSSNNNVNSQLKNNQLNNNVGNVSFSSW